MTKATTTSFDKAPAPLAEPAPEPQAPAPLKIKAITTMPGGVLKLEFEERYGHRFREAFGTKSYDFAETKVMQIVNRTAGTDEQRAQHLNAALALIEAIAPTNELEGALATQMADVDALLATIMQRAATDNRVEVAERYVTQATKLQRTFIGYVEAMAKLRGGHTQRVEVIYVDNRGGQAIVTQGGGGLEGKSRQPLEPGLAGLAVAPGLPMRGEDEGGDALPVASDPRPEALPAPRG